MIPSLRQWAVALSATTLLGCADPVTIQLTFVKQPTDVPAGQVIPPVVVSFDASGKKMDGVMDSVTLDLGTGDYPAPVLLGTTRVRAVDGIATFSDLHVDSPGNFSLYATSSSIPQGVSASFHVSVTFSGVSAGGSTACGTTMEGPTYCWGRGRSVPGLFWISTLATPGLVAQGFTFASVGAADSASCGLTAQGALYCWGSQSPDRTPLPLFPGVTFTKLSVGSRQSCALTAAGTPYCWGTLQAGPTAASTFAMVSVGYAHSCGVTATGAAYCWGHDLSGELGTGATAPDTCVDALPFAPCSHSPVPVAGGLTFATVTAGGEHTCGLTTTGAAYCWGSPSFGQLGTGGWMDSVATSPVPVAGGLTFVSISAGHSHTCALTTDGTAYCWGYNGSGRVGSPGSSSFDAPVAVQGGLRFLTISTGLDFTCGLTSNGTYCWGKSDYRQLGDGDGRDSSAVPLRVVQ
jgi:alpha-tubulin suppressor-like RCC1 family protein